MSYALSATGIWGLTTGTSGSFQISQGREDRSRAGLDFGHARSNRTMTERNS
jgi:hypothetical protein